METRIKIFAQQQHDEYIRKSEQSLRDLNLLNSQLKYERVSFISTLSDNSLNDSITGI